MPEPGQAALEPGWVASMRTGAGPAQEWLGGLVLSFCTLWAQLAAGRTVRAAPGPQLRREAWLAKLEGQGRRPTRAVTSLEPVPRTRARLPGYRGQL